MNGLRDRTRRAVKMSAQVKLLLVAVLAVTALGPDRAAAFEVKPSEDFTLRWDNTFRYTLSGRTKHQADAILASPNYDDGDRNFDRGIVSNRLDLLTELDAVYKKSF